MILVRTQELGRRSNPISGLNLSHIAESGLECPICFQALFRTTFNGLCYYLFSLLFVMILIGTDIDQLDPALRESIYYFKKQCFNSFTSSYLRFSLDITKSAIPLTLKIPVNINILMRVACRWNHSNVISNFALKIFEFFLSKLFSILKFSDYYFHNFG